MCSAHAPGVSYYVQSPIYMQWEPHPLHYTLKCGIFWVKLKPDSNTTFYCCLFRIPGFETKKNVRMVPWYQDDSAKMPRGTYSYECQKRASQKKVLRLPVQNNRDSIQQFPSSKVVQKIVETVERSPEYFASRSILCKRASQTLQNKAEKKPPLLTLWNHRTTMFCIIIDGQFRVFQRFSSRKPVLKSVETCFVTLNYCAKGVWKP